MTEKEECRSYFQIKSLLWLILWNWDLNYIQEEPKVNRLAVNIFRELLFRPFWQHLKQLCTGERGNGHSDSGVLQPAGSRWALVAGIKAGVHECILSRGMEKINQKARRDHRQLLFWPSVIYPDMSPSVSWSIWEQLQVIRLHIAVWVLIKPSGGHQSDTFSTTVPLIWKCTMFQRRSSVRRRRRKTSVKDFRVHFQVFLLCLHVKNLRHNVQPPNHPYVTKRAVLKGWLINSKIPAQYINMLRHQNCWPSVKQISKSNNEPLY